MYFVTLGWLLCAFRRAFWIKQCNARDIRLMGAGCVELRDVLA